VLNLHKCLVLGLHHNLLIIIEKIELKMLLAK
jgi:hypothetical protein